MIELIVGLGEWDVSDRNWILWALCYDGWYHYTNYRWTYKWWWRQIISIDIIIDVFNPTIKFDSTLDWFCVKEVSSIWIHCWPITCYIFVWRHCHLYIRDWCSTHRGYRVSWRPRGWRGSNRSEMSSGILDRCTWLKIISQWSDMYHGCQFDVSEYRLAFSYMDAWLSHASLWVSFWVTYVQASQRCILCDNDLSVDVDNYWYQLNWSLIASHDIYLSRWHQRDALSVKLWCQLAQERWLKWLILLIKKVIYDHTKSSTSTNNLASNETSKATGIIE